MDNLEIAKIFSRIADILEIKNENPFKVRAYRRVTQVLESLPQEVSQLYEEGKLDNIPGVGEGIAKKIKELIETGKLNYYEDLKKDIPDGLLEMMNIPEVGPRTVWLLYDRLGVDSIEELKKAAEDRKLRELPGMGPKTEENILKGLELIKRRAERIPLQEALATATRVIEPLKKLKEVKKLSIAGSLRRMGETIGDIDILLTSDEPEKVMEEFVSLPIVKEVFARGVTKSSILTNEGRQVDLRVVPEESFGAALHYFTGSKAHNIRIRELGVKKGLKINEYGIFKKEERGEVKIGGREEEDVFKSVGLPFISPELREDRGEIEAGLRKELPKLIDLNEIRGDLHVHSKWSDGNNTVEEIAEAARSRGYEYIGICDHSQSLKVAGGVSEKEFLRRIKQIRQIDERIEGIKILAMSEVDIDSEGRLDYPDELLRELDIVIATIHTGFKQDRATITERIIRAMENEYVDIIAHPTGRLLGEREPYEIDLDRVLKVAKSTGTALEINAFPNRMDLNDVHSRTAKEEGVKLAINTDAHHILQLDWISFGIAVARRAWLQAEDVVNTYPLEKLLDSLK
ncbi:MAG TPA: DNA polymerase/3'-5' exonuclease PolX [Candidatus Omnitrophica bacterium]|nr:DNA polymerase/3'-5' exonuclease PolX [Candidatus Omnitrophota bacterium]